MKLTDSSIIRRGLYSGKCTMRKGAAARLIFSESHSSRETAVSIKAWQVRKSSPAVLAVEKSDQAVIPKNTAGARAIRAAAFERIASPRLFRKNFRLMSIRETGVTCLLPPHISIRRYAAANVRGAAIHILITAAITVTASCILLPPLKSAAGCICPKYSRRLYTAASAKRKKSSAASGSRQTVMVAARLPLSSLPEKEISSRIFISHTSISFW